MKKRYIMLVILTIGLLFGVTSCSDDDDGGSSGPSYRGIDFDETRSLQNSQGVDDFTSAEIGDKIVIELNKVDANGKKISEIDFSDENERAKIRLYVNIGATEGRAEIDSYSRLVCKKAGRVSVRAIYDGKQSENDLFVNIIDGSTPDQPTLVKKLKSISFVSDPATTFANVGGTIELPKFLNALYNTGDIKQVSASGCYTVTPSGVGSISGTTFTATKAGNATFTAKYKDTTTQGQEECTVSFKVTIKEAGVTITSIEIIATKTSLNAGDRVELTAFATYSDNNKDVVIPTYNADCARSVGYTELNTDENKYYFIALKANSDSDTTVTITGVVGGVSNTVTLTVLKTQETSDKGDTDISTSGSANVDVKFTEGNTVTGSSGSTGGGGSEGTGGGGGTDEDTDDDEGTGGGGTDTDKPTEDDKKEPEKKPEPITDRIVIHAKTAGAIWYWAGDSGSTGADLTPTGKTGDYNDFTIKATTCNIIMKKAAGGWDKLSGDIEGVKAGEYWYEGSGDTLSTTNPNSSSDGGGSGTGGGSGGGDSSGDDSSGGDGGGDSSPSYSGDETLEGNFNQLRIYQVMVTSFIDGDPGHGYKEMWGPSNAGAGGDLEGVIKAIPYIKALGCNAIWMTPVFDSTGADGGVKLNATGYYVSDYFAIDPNFGSMQTFDKLVAEAHANGIYIILDGVFGHNGKIKKASPGGKRPAGPTGGNIYTGLDWTNQGTQEYYKEVSRWWITEHKIDGWRLDQCYQVGNYGDGVHTGGHNYWYDVRLEVEKASAANSGTWGTLGYMVGENWDGNAAHIQAQSVSPGGGSGYGLRSCFDFPSYYSLVGCFKDSKSIGDCVGYVHKNGQEKGYNHDKGYYPNVFLTNHDVPHFGNQLRPSGNDQRDAWYYGQHVAALAVVATSPNPITIYQGDEWGDMTVGYNVNTGSGNGASDNSSRTPGRTAAVTNGKLTQGGLGGGLSGDALKCAQSVAAILNARKAYPDIWKQSTQYVSGDNDFYVGKKGSKITFAINRSGTQKSFNASGKEVITGSSVSGSCQVPAYSVRIVVSN